MRILLAGTPACLAVLCVALSAAPAAELATFTMKEPLGQDWTDEWLTQEITIQPSSPVKAAALELVATPPGSSVAAQFYHSGRLLQDADEVTGKATLKVLFRATIRRGETLTLAVTDGGKTPRPWPPIAITEKGGKAIIANGAGELEFDAAKPLPLSAMRAGSAKETLGVLKWPQGAAATGVKDQWAERGPARAILKRTFQFRDPARRYEIVFDIRAGDPWIDVTDTYALGRGTAIELDLRALNADFVYHPHAYNARTFKADGKEEDSTLEPPQHAIATLGPIWRDIWFGGGPFAFIYNSKGDAGVGLAAVRGSEWDAPDGISLESQNLFVHGDREKEGQVRVLLPTDGGTRRWALVLGPPNLRKRLGRLVRSHADIPLETVLKEWVLDWESGAKEVKAGAAGMYAGSYFNQHFFNPTTYPRTVRRQIPNEGPVKSRDLAVLAYVFSNPNYWPGPKYKWAIGNPNFHTDMYSIPLRIGLVMPDHPHAKRWLQAGVEETRGNLERDSFPGGAWKESLSYASFFFHVVENARRLRDAGAAQPFKEWPRFKEVATYLAAMHTPVDPRYGSRQKAPIGDTGPGHYVKELGAMADVYRGLDDKFAGELARFPEKWDGALDLSSREFYGFGAMLRGHAYDDRHESFVTVKAGPARNHFQGDELSFCFASLGAPLALDYACHYSPRPWSAAIHNRPDMNGKRPVAVAARRAFAASEAADVFVADERTWDINEVPMEPHLAAKPGWEYPNTKLPADKPWTMRRFVMLVKHNPKASRIADYLVVRDEIKSPEPIGWNLHVLARDIKADGQTAVFPGQLDIDAAAHFITPRIGDIEKREWGWRAVDGGALRTTKGKEYEEKYFGAYLPKDFQRGTWGQAPGTGGEMGKWLRVRAEAGLTKWLVVIVPNLQGQDAPKVERLSDSSARVSLGGESEVVHLGTDGQFQAAVERGGKTVTLLKAGDVKPWAQVEFKPLPPTLDRGAK